MATIGNVSECIDYLKQKIDIVQVMGEATYLQSAGNSDVHKGLCCFHSEKTPSLSVTRSKGFYHCFGCKKSGDIVTFYKEYHGYSTIEAIYLLAQNYNIDISQFERELTPEEKERFKLLKINKKLAEGLHAKLMIGANRGYDYLHHERGVSEEMMKDFMLGYVEDLSDIYSILADEDPNDITKLQLDNDMMFTDAIVYPMTMPNGDIIGFKTRPYYDGQTVDPKSGFKLAKFVGTSNKSPIMNVNTLYGIHLARRAVKGKSLVVVEGQHDVIGMRMFGIENVAGSEGTALTEENLKLLEDHGINDVIVMFDGDNAGREAAISIARHLPTFKTRVSIKIAVIPNGYDPDQLLLQKGKIEALRIIEDAVYANQYLIDIALDTMDTKSVTAKIDVIRYVQQVLANAPAYEEAFLIQYVAGRLNVRYDIIEDMMREQKAKTSESKLYNLEGERIVLGGMMRDQDFRLEVMAQMRSDDWYVYKHQVVYDMISEMEEQQVNVNLETMKSTVNNKNLGAILGDGIMIDELYTCMGDYKTLLDDIVDKSHRRKVIKQSERMIKEAGNLKTRLPVTIEEHIDSLVGVMDAETSDGVVNPEDGSKNFMATLVDRMQNPNQIVGLDLGEGFKTTTKILNGLQKKKLMIIAANQSVGKTTITANFLNEIAVTQRKPWAHFTIEMTKEEIVTKVIGIRAGVNSQMIERGNLTDDEFIRVRQASIEYHEGGLIVYDDKATLESIMNEVRVLQRRCKALGTELAGISIDYIQLMSVERNKNKQRYEELGDISGALKNDVAKKMSIPVIALSQLNRDALKSDVATAESGSGSYKIAQDADIYITLKEKSAEEIEQWGLDKGNITMNIDKNRGGRADVLIDIIFQKDLQIMKEAI